MKKYLLDENLDSNINESVFSLSPFVNSISVLGRRAPDSKVFEYACKHNLIVVTMDKRFALDMIVSGSKTVFVDHNYKTTLVNPKIDVNPKYASPLAHYMQEHNIIIIP